jgi:purple acid phosphatase-like protein
MVRRRQTLKIDHIPAQLTLIRPHHPSFRHRRFTSPTSATENHSPSESANSFTRSHAGLTDFPRRGGSLDSHFAGTTSNMKLEGRRDHAPSAPAVSCLQDVPNGICSMTRQVLKLAIAATVGCMLSTPILAQILRPAAKAAHVEITQEPTLEMAVDDLAIIRWTTSNPGGDDQHFGIVRYGTDPRELSRVAKSPIRINRVHPETIFRVRLKGLKPQTTYHFAVTSTASNGEGDGVESSVHQFTTPRPGERIVAYPP